MLLLLVWCRTTLQNHENRSSNKYNQSVFVHDLQERFRSKNYQLPFEFKALEAILISVTSSMQSELEALEIPVNRLLDDLEGLADSEEGVNQKRLKICYVYPRNCQNSNMMSPLSGMLLTNYWNSVNIYDDLAAMYAKKSDALEYEEVELLLEAYLKQTEEIANETSHLISNLKSTEDVVQLTLDLSRNALM